MKIRQLLQQRKVRITLILGVTAFTLFNIRAQISRIQGQGSTEMPEEHDTGGKVPGDPENAVQDFKRIYQCINIFRARHEGRYPSDMQLVNAIKVAPREYGFSDWNEAAPLFTNPDIRYSDSQGWRKMSKDKDPMHLYMPYLSESKRPDGLPLNSEKPPGTRNVLVWSDLYYHANFKMDKDGGTENPVGFYVVLWDDGAVEKIPYYQRLYVPKPNSEWTMAFPGQAGLPKGTLTYDQFYTQVMGFKQPPRGSVGGKGVGYKTQSRP